MKTKKKERALEHGSWRCKPLKMKMRQNCDNSSAGINPSPIKGDDERGKEILANCRLRSNLTAQILNKLSESMIA